MVAQFSRRRYREGGTDPAMLAKVQMYNAGLNRLFDVEIATLVTPLDSRAEALRTAECSIGNLVADSIRNAAPADVAIINGGSIRGNRIYPAGTKLLKRDILDELPFGNKTLVTNVPGKAILDALENGFSQMERPAGRFPQVSGLSIIADPAPPRRRLWDARGQDACERGFRHKARRPRCDRLCRGGENYRC